MIAHLDAISLATGEMLTVKLLTCPEPGYADDVGAVTDGDFASKRDAIVWLWEMLGM